MARSSNVERIIEQIMASDRLKASAHFSSSVYGDEPILRTASQMSGFLPSAYREMRAVAQRPEALGAPSSWVFVEQARLMESFEDSFPEHAPFERYYPTYQAMTDRQLRTYFTWRTQARAGTVQQISLSYAFVYLYELINLVGCATAAEAFDKLQTFWQAWRAFDTGLDRNARVWLRDLALYHGLDPARVKALGDGTYDAALLELARAERAATGTDPLAPARSPMDGEAAPSNTQSAEKRSRKQPAYDFAHPAVAEQELFSAICALSAYRVENSRLYKEQPRLMRRATCAIFWRLAAYYRRNRKSGLTESLFGTFSTLPYRPFENAVFYEAARHEDATWELSEVDRFFCASGRWWRTTFHGAHDRSPRLGRLMRTIDRELRRALDFPYQLKDGAAPKYLQQIVNKELAGCLAWEKAHAPRVIQIDRSKLSGIRSAAASTREALLVDEERADEPTGAFGAPAAREVATGTQATATPLDAAAGPSGNAERQPGLFDAETWEAGHGTERGSRAGTPAAAATPAPAAAPDAQPAPAPSAPGAAPFSPTAGAAPGTPDLSLAERALLEALVAGSDPAPALAQADMLPSVFVDQLNEKLFDVVGDAVVEFDGANPVLVEDYHEDMQDLLRETA